MWDNELDKALRLLEKLGIGKDRNLGYGKFIVKEIKDYDLNLGNRRYRYLTGRAYPEGEFMTDRFDRVQMMGGDISLCFFHCSSSFPRAHW